MADPARRATESESEDEGDRGPSLANPPPGLFQRARDFLGREVSARELIRVWDQCRDQTTVEAKSHAAMGRLLMGSDPVDELEQPHPTMRYKPAKDRPPTPGREPRARSTSVSAAKEMPKKAGRVFDLTEENDDDKPGPSKKGKGKDNAKKRLFEPDDEDADSSVELIVKTKKAKLKAPKTREVIDLDSDDDTQMLAPQDAAGKAGGKSSSSSSSSSNDIAKVGKRKRSQSTPLTPPDDRLEVEPKGVAEQEMVQEVQGEPSLLLQVLAIVPDVDHNHAQNLIDKFSSQQDCLEHVIDALFSDKAYPKAERFVSGSRDKGKGRAVDVSEETLEEKEKRYMDLKGRAKPSPAYCLAAFDYLDIDFPWIPKPYLRTVLNRAIYYAPAHAELSATMNMAAPPYSKLNRPRKDKGKGPAYNDAELDTERDFVQTKDDLEKAALAAQKAEEEKEAIEEAAGHVFECGCCFGDYVFSKSIQCPDAHLFCMDCARRNAETAMGNRQTVISCMDTDGCTMPFSDAECAKFLKPNQLVLLDKLRSETALDAAGIAGLVKCPYCPWACVIDNPDERLFRCEKEDCLKITCRHCQKADHLPKTCEEHAEDLKKNNIHKVEEAMTAAALRKCPKCRQVYIKEYGCNKMTCTNRNCGALSCYLCGELVQGYGHFRGQAVPGGMTNTTSKCELWDKNEGKNEYERIEAARKAAIEEVKTMGGEDAQLNEEELAKLAADKPTVTGYRTHPGPRPPAQYPAMPQMPAGIRGWGFGGLPAVPGYVRDHNGAFVFDPGYAAAGVAGMPGALPGHPVPGPAVPPAAAPPPAPAAQGGKRKKRK